MSKNYEIKLFDNPSHYANIFNKADEKYFNYLSLNNIHNENQSKKEFLFNKFNIENPDYSNITVIIPFRDVKDAKRIENLEIVMNHLKIIGAENIIISEEDEFSKLDDLVDEWSNIFKNFRLLFNKSHDLFNKANAVNEGVKKANTQYVVMMDSDVLIPKNVFDESVSLLNTFFDFIYPFNRMVQQIYSVDGNIKDFNFDKVNSEIEVRPNADGGCLFCNKQSLLNIGGFNPSYKGWGGEDNELTLRINLSDYKCVRLNNILFHLHHSKKRVNGSNVGSLLKSSNLSRFNDINILINENKEMYFNSRMFNDSIPKLKTGNYLISVIIPVISDDFFYLDRCITSLKNQTLGFENIEVILVCQNGKFDDLIKHYVEKYDNIKSKFLNSNLSINIARNEGLKEAMSNYVLFLDCDDYYVKYACEIFYKNIIAQDADIILTNFINLENTSEEIGWTSLINLNNNNKKILYDYNDFKEVFLIPPSIGTKLYKKDFLIKNNLFFKNYTYGDELLFNYETLLHAKTIELINIPSIVYSYDKNENKEFTSSILDYQKNSLINIINAIEESYNLFNKFAPKLAYIALDNLNQLFNKFLFRSNLSFEEFVDISTESYLLITNYLESNKVNKSQNFLNLLELIKNGELIKAYENYLELL